MDRKPRGLLKLDKKWAGSIAFACAPDVNTVDHKTGAPAARVFANAVKLVASPMGLVTQAISNDTTRLSWTNITPLPAIGKDYPYSMMVVAAPVARNQVSRVLLVGDEAGPSNYTQATLAFNANTASTVDSGYVSFWEYQNGFKNKAQAGNVSLDGSWKVFIVNRYGGNNSPTIHINGINRTISSAYDDAWNLSMPAGVHLIGPPVSTLQGTQDPVAFGVVFNRTLSPAEVQALSQNPFQIFQSVNDPIFIYRQQDPNLYASGVARVTAELPWPSLTAQIYLSGTANPKVAPSGLLGDPWTSKIVRPGGFTSWTQQGSLNIVKSTGDGGFIQTAKFGAGALLAATASATVSHSVNLTAAGAAAELATSQNATVTTTAALTRGDLLAASASAAVTTSATMAVAALLDATASATVTDSVALTRGDLLTTSASAAVTDSVALTTTIQLVGAETAAVTHSAALSVGDLLATAVDAAVTATAALTRGDLLATSATASVETSSALTATIQLNGAESATVTDSVSLASVALFDATATATVTDSATLTRGDLFVTAVTAQVTVTAALTRGDLFATAETVTVTFSAALTATPPGISSVVPVTFYDGQSGVIIYGWGFGVSEGDVYIGNVKQTVLSWANDQIALDPVSYPLSGDKELSVYPAAA